MKLRIPNPFQAYGVTVLFVALAFASRWALDPLIGESAPYMLFLLAAILSAVFGGLGPGLLATVAGQLLAHYFFMEPPHRLYPDTLQGWVYSALCYVVTIVCLAIVEALHHASAKSDENLARAKRHEEQLRTIIREMTAAQERVRELASVVESAEDSIISTTREGVVKSWNSGAEQLFGFSSAQMCGQPIRRIVPEDKIEEHRALLAVALAGQSPAAIETKRLTATGQMLEVSVRCSPLRDSTGNVIGVSFIGRDISSAKQAEAEINRLNRDLNHHLKESRQVMEVLPFGLAIATDPACTNVEINPVLARMFGVNSSRIEFRTGPSAFSIRQNGTDVPPGRMPLQLAAAENSETIGWKGEICRPDGSSVHVLVHAAPLHDSEGKVRGATAAFIDISDSKHAHEALLETEQRFRAMADTAPLMIWMTDADQRSTWVNKTWRIFTGRESELEPPEGWAEPIHPEDRVTWKRAIEESIENKVSFELEYRLRKSDGEWRWVLDRGVPRFSQDGRFLGCIGSCMDVTEWKQAEDALENKFEELRTAQQELRAQNEQLAQHRKDLELERGRYRELFDSAPIGYVITSRQGVIQQVNCAAAEMLNESAGFLEGFPFARLLARQDRATFFANIGKLTRNEVACITGWDVTITPHNCTAFPCTIIVNLLNDDEGSVLGLRWILRDVTERREAEARIMRLNAELEQRVRERTAALEAANRELEAFSYSVSHDLRAPLRSINGFSKAALEEYSDKLDEQGVKYLRYAYEASVRMGRLIEDLLELSRVGRGELQCGKLNVSELVESVAWDLRNRSSSSTNVDLVIQPGLWARADAGLLRIALENLLSNAWKFTGGRSPARIEVGLTANGGKQCLFIRDNGAGFDMAHAGRLFGVFQRLHSEQEFPGTGIGLATVKRVILRHGGQVWAEAKVGEGASFYFTLPEFGADAPAPATTERNAEPPHEPEPILPDEAPRSKRLRVVKFDGQHRNAHPSEI